VFFRRVNTGCVHCGKLYTRKSRGIVRRILCSSAFCCEHCGTGRYYYRVIFAMFQWYAYCPACHNFELSRLRKADKIDPMSLNPLRRILRLIGFPLYYCTFCRIQFGDFHPLHPDWVARRPKR
jgi:hypothetical protein